MKKVVAALMATFLLMLTGCGTRVNLVTTSSEDDLSSLGSVSFPNETHASSSTYISDTLHESLVESYWQLDVTENLDYSVIEYFWGDHGGALIMIFSFSTLDNRGIIGLSVGIDETDYGYYYSGPYTYFGNGEYVAELQEIYEGDTDSPIVEVTFKVEQEPSDKEHLDVTILNFNDNGKEAFSMLFGPFQGERLRLAH